MELRREQAEWKDFELLDSGDFEKLERLGDVTMVRPEPQALWKPAGVQGWSEANLVYSRKGKEGEWQGRKNVPESWEVSWEDLKFHVRPTSFKHTGLFPEQASNWKYLRQTLQPGMKVLNLFGYTGGATLAAASVGAEVTHCDAAKSVVAVCMTPFSWTHLLSVVAQKGKCGNLKIICHTCSMIVRRF